MLSKTSLEVLEKYLLRNRVVDEEQAQDRERMSILINTVSQIYGEKITSNKYYILYLNMARSTVIDNDTKERTLMMAFKESIMAISELQRLANALYI